MTRPLCTDPTTLTVGSVRAVVEFRRAAWWLDLLPHVTPAYALLHALEPGASQRLRTDVLDGALSLDDIKAASYKLIGRVTGTGARWWVGYNITAIAGSAYTVGAMTLRGADPERCTLPQWNSAVEHLYLDGAKESDRMRWLAATEMPPPGAETDATWDSGMSAEQMIAMAARMPGMG